MRKEPKKSAAYKNYICYALAMLVMLSGCTPSSTERKAFVMDEDIKQLMEGEYVGAWLRKAAYNNELKQADEDKLIFTNAKQVFPFMNRYYDRLEELRAGSDPATDTVVYTTTEVLYQDSVWGDVFVAASLLYDKREVFLDDSYLETGDPFFGRSDAVTDVHRASLHETAILAKTTKYKTGIYKVWTNHRDYLLGFYQQGQLVFEAVVPLLGLDSLASLNKMKEINRNLGLNIPEWEQATVAQLKQTNKPSSFWQDPFIGIYPGEYVNLVYLKLKDSALKPQEQPSQGDHSFAYSTDAGEVSLYTTLQTTDMSKEAFVKANESLHKYRFRHQDIFYEEQQQDKFIEGIAKIYIKKGQYLTVHFSYPAKDSEAKKEIHAILRSIYTIG